MMSIPVPSETCPHCRAEGSQCHMIINPIPMTREREKYFLIELGKKAKEVQPQITEGYFVYKYLCLNK